VRGVRGRPQPTDFIPIVPAESLPQCEPEVVVVLERAREVVEGRETGAAVGNDDAFQAASELRSLYERLLDAPEAEAGADLRYRNGDLRGSR